MIVDISDLNRKKVSKKNVHLVYNEESFYDEGEKIEFLKPVVLEGNLYLIEDLISLEGEIFTEVNLTCSRCLSDFSQKIDLPVHEKFSINPENEDDEVIFVNGDTIDITDVIKNNIIISLPIKKLCKNDCKGLCQHCGTNLNISSCNCAKDDIDPRLSRLKDLFSAD